MHKYVINTGLGLFIVRAETPAQAFVEYSTSDVPLQDSFLDREDLWNRGYTALYTTEIRNVYKIIK